MAVALCISPTAATIECAVSLINQIHLNCVHDHGPDRRCGELRGNAVRCRRARTPGPHLTHVLSGMAAQDIATDSAGNLYLTGGPFVRALSATGKLTTIAGSGASLYYGGDGGPASAARLHAPSAIVRDDLGNWYISDTGNNRIRKIDAAGMPDDLRGHWRRRVVKATAD